MIMTKVDFSLLDSEAIAVTEDVQGSYFMIGDVRADLPPHYGSKKFSANELITFFLDKLGDVGVGLVVFFLCELIKKKKIGKVRINGKQVNTESEIIDALTDEQDDKRD